MPNSTTLLPRVYTLGFRAGQTLHGIYTTWLTAQQHGDTVTYSNKLWFSIQQEAPAMWSAITSFPLWYRTWWMDLLRNDPVHVVVETTLILAVLYMFFSRTKDWKESKKDKLTIQEEDDLIKEWREKGRAPLVASRGTPAAAKDVPSFIVHKMQGTTMEVSMDDRPEIYKVINFGTFDFLGMAAEFTTPENNLVNNNNDEASSIPEEKNTAETINILSETTSNDGGGEGIKENDVINGNGNPNEAVENHDAAVSKNVKRKKKKKAAGAKAAVISNDAIKNSEVSVKSSNNPMKQASVEALMRYGVGACGPRGFYGTIDPHLKLEAEITKFMGSEGAILYSDGASTVSSTVAAFCKRGDLLVVDEGVREPLVAGVKLSRAYVKWYKHNDMVRGTLFVPVVLVPFAPFSSMPC
jgi:Aminotransferase class I and II